MYVYFQTEKSLYTVGFYKPNGQWVSESDHETSAAAAARVSYLNGGSSTLPDSILEALNSGDGSYRP